MKRTMMAVVAAWAFTAGAAFGQGATQLKVVNATAEKVEVRVNNATGGTTSFQFTTGTGHFDPVPLAQGLGDRVVSVRVITASGAVVLPSRVLATSTFDPANAAQSVLVLTFIRGTLGDDIIYTTSAGPEAVGDPLAVRNGPKGKGELSPEQKKAVEEVLKKPALKGGN